MPTQIVNRRRDKRHKLPSGVGAEIEFNTPDGRTHVLPLVEVSISGLSFEIPRRLDGIETGAKLPAAMIRLGRLQVQGNLVVMRMVRGFGPDYTVGVEFHPRTDGDRNELIELITRLTALGWTDEKTSWDLS